MRKFAAAFLAVPVLAVILVPSLLTQLGRRAGSRFLSAVGIVVALGALGCPDRLRSRRPTAPHQRRSDEAFRSDLGRDGPQERRRDPLQRADGPDEASRGTPDRAARAVNLGLGRDATP